jgi:RhoGAP domain
LASFIRNLTSCIAGHTANGFVLLRSKIRRLPAVHRASLKAVVEHLSRIASHAEKNKMDAKNLAIVFSPVVFGEEEISQGDLLNVQPTKVCYISYLSSGTHSCRTL